MSSRLLALALPSPDYGGYVGDVRSLCVSALKSQNKEIIKKKKNPMAPVHSLGTLMLSSCISQSPLHVGEHGRDTYNYSLPIFFSSHSNHPFAATFTKITFVKIPSELCDLR